jgi:hypothetical protein
MKMRHKAQPGDPRDKNKPVTIDQKLHVKVSAEEKGNEEKVLWFQKVMHLPFPDDDNPEYPFRRLLSAEPLTSWPRNLVCPWTQRYVLLSLLHQAL